MLAVAAISNAAQVKVPFPRVVWAFCPVFSVPTFSALANTQQFQRESSGDEFCGFAEDVPPMAVQMNLHPLCWYQVPVPTSTWCSFAMLMFLYDEIAQDSETSCVFCTKLFVSCLCFAPAFTFTKFHNHVAELEILPSAQLLMVNAI